MNMLYKLDLAKHLDMNNTRICVFDMSFYNLNTYGEEAHLTSFDYILSSIEWFKIPSLQIKTLVMFQGLTIHWASFIL